MSDEAWIVIPNWEKFQHYPDREPVWLKLYAELNSRDDWRALTYAERGVLVSIWIEYARARGVLRVDDIGNRIGLRKHYAHLYAHIESLNHAGWIEVSASKPLALTRSREKKENREEKARVPAREDHAPQPLKKRVNARAQAEAWIANGTSNEVPAERLADVISDEFGITEPDLLHDLVKRATERKVTP